MKLSRNMLALLVLAWVLLAGWLEWQHYQNQTESLIVDKTIAGRSATADLAKRLENTLELYHSLPLMLAQDPLVLAVLTGGDCLDSNPVPYPGATATNTPCETASIHASTSARTPLTWPSGARVFLEWPPRGK